jgi:hypothetical protein
VLFQKAEGFEPLAEEDEAVFRVGPVPIDSLRALEE